MNVEVLLSEEIEAEFEKLRAMELGTEEHRNAVHGLTQLINQKMELETKPVQMVEEKRARLVTNSIAVVGIVVPAGITIWGALKSWEFEKEGTVTSMMGRMFMNGFKPKK